MLICNGLRTPDDFFVDCSSWEQAAVTTLRDALPIPECSRALAARPPAAPPVLALLYAHVVWRESMAVTAVVWKLDAGTLAA